MLQNTIYKGKETMVEDIIMDANKKVQNYFKVQSRDLVKINSMCMHI